MPELISPLDLYQFADRCRCPVVSLTDEVLLGWGVHLLPSRPFVSTYIFRGTFLTQFLECKFANDQTCYNATLTMSDSCTANWCILVLGADHTDMKTDV
jgi:hypothetical protein